MALALGFFLRRIHRRIDALIDELLFRDRHKVERNLRRAALEVAFITESEALMTFTHDVVVRNLALKACALYLRRTDGSFEALRMSGTVASVLDCNEPAIVRIRMTRLPVRIEDTTSSLAGVLLLPMLVRDGLIGTVLLGAKLDGEDFAPDEREALRDLVEAMGRSLDALESARLRAEVQQLLRDDALPATGRKRLERSVGSSIKRRVEPGVVEAGPGGEKAPTDHGPGRVIRVGSGGDQEVRA
jgi:hypothetical protein